MKTPLNTTPKDKPAEALGHVLYETVLVPVHSYESHLPFERSRFDIGL
jgi:hypothetical protein